MVSKEEEEVKLKRLEDAFNMLRDMLEKKNKHIEVLEFIKKEYAQGKNRLMDELDNYFYNAWDFGKSIDGLQGKLK